MPARSRDLPNGLDPRGFELEADLIRTLANPKRLMIVSLLGTRPCTVTEIAERLDLSLQNASQHLRLMKDRDIVRAHRDGRAVHYALTSPVFSECCRLVRQALLAEARARPTQFGVHEPYTVRTGDRRAGTTHPVRRPALAAA